MEGRPFQSNRTMGKKVVEMLSLSGKTAIITGGAGLLGVKHAEAIAEFGGNPIILDIEEHSIQKAVQDINLNYKTNCIGLKCDITKLSELEASKSMILNEFESIDILINNAALDPKIKDATDYSALGRLENFSIERWDLEINVGLTGAFLCTQVFGKEMARVKSGNIINISSDLGVIATS